MQTKKQVVLLAALALLLSAGWYGCSDGTVSTVISQDEAAGGLANAYLPADEGYTIVFNVTYSDRTESVMTLKTGRRVQLGSVTAVEWIGTTGGVADTGYIVPTTDRVYFYESASSAPEKIVEMPLTIGQTWLRFSDSDFGDGDFTDIITGIDKEDDTTVIYDPLEKVFPSTGGNTMTVVAREQLQLSNGMSFSDVVRVCNESLVPDKVNYYWFVANVGLVKYVIGAPEGDCNSGDVVGELLDYGY